MSDITIRPATPDDAEALLDIYAPYVRETAVTFEYEVPTKAEFRNRIIHTLVCYPYLVAEFRSIILGYAYTGAFVGRAAYGWAAETSVYVDKNCRRQGIGRALYEALEAVSRAQHLLNLEACIGVPDGADDTTLTHNSADFHAHMGYRMVGEFRRCGYKFGRWYNMVWMEKCLGSHPAQPAAVIPFSQLAPETLRRCGLTL